MRGLKVFSLVLGLTLVAASTAAAVDPAGAGDTVVDTSSAATRYTQALNILEDKGYPSFINFHRAGNEFQATATVNGKSVTLAIDADANTVQIMR